MNAPVQEPDVAVAASQSKRQAPLAKRWSHAPSSWLYKLRSHEATVLIALFLATFVAYFCAADLKGIWNDDAVRLTIANGGEATSNLENRHPGHSADVIRAIGRYAVQPGYPLLVNRILRVTHSYSVIPIVTFNLLIFLFSAAGIYLLARRLLTTGPRLLAVLLYLWNGFAMVHVLQAREYPLILFCFVYNTLFFYRLLDPLVDRNRLSFWLAAVAHCLSCVAAFYTTKWAAFFLWPQAVIALVAIRSEAFRALAVLGSLGIAALGYLPSLLSISKSNVVFAIWDKRAPSMGLLFFRLHVGTEHLLVGYRRASLSFLGIYYWGLLLILIAGLVILGYRFFCERFEIQHLVLTTLGFLSFQVAYFFLREPLSTWPRYFILYLPYVVLLIPLTFSRALAATSQPASRKAWCHTVFLLIAAVAGFAQLNYNYRNPYIDHGPDFREVYRYLVSRVAPRDKVVVGSPTNRMAFNYYWPTPQQVQLGYKITESESSKLVSDIWTVGFKDEKSRAYRDYARKLEHMGYKLQANQLISKVTIRHFQLRAKKRNRSSTPDT